MARNISSLLALSVFLLITGCSNKKTLVSFETGPGQHGIFTFHSTDLKDVLRRYPPGYKSGLLKLIKQKTQNGKASILDSEWRMPRMILTLIEEKKPYTVFCKKCGTEVPTGEITIEKKWRNGEFANVKDKRGHHLLFVQLSKR